ncbi:hydroxyethylthiazole kinase [Legionella dresdenensis]|uniref:Hydroxyethylthiazole kinase n=1 Tax=Legionella dresdenensis TaxID=450200 RepID=A0ABV8CEA0_9GAMM
MLTVEQLHNALSVLRARKPLVLSLTNQVTMDLMANSLLALGAAPLMSNAFEEAGELLALSQALNINIGTLNSSFGQDALQTAKLANADNIPVILDPVGAGASQLRTFTAQSLMPHVSIIRGNASEILALADEINTTRGVDAEAEVRQATEVATRLTLNQRTIVVSGAVDFVTDGSEAFFLPFGSRLMTRVTGMGCTLTAVIAAFAGSGFSLYQAALYGTAYFGLCGMATESKTLMPGTFRQLFIDQLYNPNWDLFARLIDQNTIKEH